MTTIATKPSVLIVDDAPENIDILSNILRNDYRILVANSGERALEICARQQPTLILLDVMMPGMNGYEVCRRLKQDVVTADIPVILVTAANRDQDEIEGLAAGAVDFLTKPVSPPIVAARVRTHVDLKQQRDLLHKLSQVDGLTGVANRRHFDEALAREARRCARRRTDLALLLADVDSYASFNQLYGRAAGDRCLKRIAATLARAVTRPGDVAARLHDDRFALLLPETDAAGLRHLAERIAGEIANLFIPHVGARRGDYLTVSLAGLSVKAGDDAELADLPARAEHLLQKAKQSGATVVLTGPQGEEPTVPVVACTRRSFDPALGLRRTGGDPERYREFLSRFLAEHAEDARVIEQDLVRGDRASARRLAHTLESLAGSLGANALAGAASRLFGALDDGVDADEELAGFREELADALRLMRATVAGEPAAVAAPVRGPVTADAAARMVGELAHLLASADSEALWLFQSNRATFAQMLPPQRYQRLDAALTHFDYDSAMAALAGAAPGEGHDTANA